MKRIKLTVAYDGTNYCGWQIQPNGITIEAVLNQKLSELTGETIKVIGASRTDSGVHALGNVAVFDTQTTIPPERIMYALNQKLPDDIAVMRSEEVPADWHPRYQKSRKTYEYHIINQEVPIPTKRFTNYFVSYPLNVERMKKAASYLVGEHDFASFCSIHTSADSTIRTIYDLEVSAQEKEITIRVTGNGFLYNMVRIIAGVLVCVGRGYYEPERVKEMLTEKTRTADGITAPPQGLTLVGIRYESGLKKIL